MGTFLATFVIMALAILAMAVGVIAGRRELKGSCGGMNIDSDGSCPCGRSTPCDKPQTPQSSTGQTG